MVLLVVKGTRFPDEFIVERPLTSAVGNDADAVDGADELLPRTLCRMQNTRHHLRLMLLSAGELAATAVGPPEGLAAYKASIEALEAALKDKATPVAPATVFDEAVTRLRRETAELLPQYCVKDGATAEAAVERLYALHEDPELSEDARLTVYHCRAVMDPQWKANEAEPEETAGLWFCGKVMSGTLARYCGRNEKSRLVVKVAPRAGPAPSGEPRMRYEDQRAVYEHARLRREAFATLEDSELRDRVLQQSRGAVVMPSAGAGAGAEPTLQTAQLRPIHANRSERIVSE